MLTRYIQLYLKPVGADSPEPNIPLMKGTMSAQFLKINIIWATNEQTEQTYIIVHLCVFF